MDLHENYYFKILVFEYTKGQQPKKVYFDGILSLLCENSITTSNGHIPKHAIGLPIH